MKAHKQTGASLLGIAIIIFVLGGIAFIGIKVSPIYFEFFQVDSSMEALAAQPETGGLTSGKVKRALIKRLRIDEVRDIKREHISVKREDGIMSITVSYEKRNQALETLDLVGRYNRTIKVKIPEL
jgi:hypothetical protein